MPDPRLPLEPGKAYHIWTQANGRDNLFRSQENYRYFLEKYSKYAHPVVETFAYHGFVKHPEDWPHASWHAYVGGKGTKINRAEVINWFGGMEAFLDLHGALEQANGLALEEDAL